MVEHTLLSTVINENACEVRSVDAGKIALARRQMLDDETYLRLAETFQALADGSRLKLIYALRVQEMCVCDLAAVVGVSESAVSQHLRQLRLLRLVKSRREGKMVYYSLDDAHIQLLLNVCLSHVRHEDEPAISGQQSAISSQLSAVSYQAPPPQSKIENLKSKMEG